MYVFGFVSNVTFQTASFSNAYFLLHLLLLCRQTKLSFELGWISYECHLTNITLLTLLICKVSYDFLLFQPCNHKCYSLDPKQTNVLVKNLDAAITNLIFLHAFTCYHGHKALSRVTHFVMFMTILNHKMLT